MTTAERARSLIEHQSEAVCVALEALGRKELEAASLLPGWSRLTVACHLRYVSQAVLQMTEATLAGRQSSFYPGGRSLQRPFTLEPALGEPPMHVVQSLRETSTELVEQCRAITAEAWSGPVVGDEADPDAMRMPLLDLHLLRLTELTVHATDLGLGASPTTWAAEFGRLVLRQRLTRLQSLPAELAGRWMFAPVDSSPLAIHVDDSGAVAPAVEVPAGAAEARVVLTGTATELVAVLLGRAPLSSVEVSADDDLSALLGQRLAGP